MRNDEPTWEQTAVRVNDHFDGLLILPLIVYLSGLIAGDIALAGYALLVWALAVMIWTPWIIVRVNMANPPGDAWRAVAILGLGLLPWGVSPVRLQRRDLRLRQSAHTSARTWTGSQNRPRPPSQRPSPKPSAKSFF